VHAIQAKWNKIKSQKCEPAGLDSTGGQQAALVAFRPPEPGRPLGRYRAPDQAVGNSVLFNFRRKAPVLLTVQRNC
jgi:hypothetical protein